jgi:predicted Zn-dependent protease
MFHSSKLVSSLKVSLMVLACASTFAYAVIQDDKKKEETPPPEQKQVKKVQDQRHQKEIDSDTKIGGEYVKEVEKQYKLSTNEEMIKRVETIGNALADIANENLVTVTWGDKRLSPFSYTFKVIEGEDVNAFSLPGGYIYVYEGLLKFSQSDDEVAGVLSHEVAHAALRHVATLQKEQSRLQLVTLPLILASIFSGASGSGGEAAAGLGNLAVLVGTAKASGWSLSAEEAADYAGLQYMMKSKYEPSGIVTFMERLNSKNKVIDNLDWGIYRTHPPTADRVRALLRRMNELKIPVRRSLASPAYRSAVVQAGSDHELLFDGNVVFRFNGANSADRAAKASKLVDQFLDTLPNLYEVRLEGMRVIGAGRTLFEVTEEDIEGSKTSKDEFMKQTLKNVQRAVAAVRAKAWVQ